MKLKCKKINGVEKNICTAEQKIAYNYAFSYHNIYSVRIKEYIKKYGFEPTEISKNELYFEIENIVIKDIKNRDDMKKYNIDAIIIAFRNGFVNYCNDFFIATDYEMIGKCFIIPYDIE